jgi:SET family sugar efflux transporter-like MFS transporter
MRVFERLPSHGALIFLLLLTNSFCLSSIVPLMSFFIVEGLGAPAWQIGLYTGLMMPMALVANRWAGERIDNGARIRRILLLAVIAYLLATATLTQVSNFLVFLMVVAPLMSVANIGTGTIFSFGRLYAERSDLDVGRMNSWLRMAVSMAWVVGPALSFTVVAEFGFSATYTFAVLFGGIYLLLWHLVVPKDFRSDPKNRRDDADDRINWGLLGAGLTCMMFIITNSLFLSAMPLYFVREVGLPGSTPGFSLSVKCLTEVFVIFVSARLAEKIGVRQVLMVSAALAVTSMVLFSMASSVADVIAISTLEGIYYGLFAGVSITYVQSFAPERPGRATAVYMNSLFLASMIGSVSMGFIASACDFRTVLFVAAASAGSGLVILMATFAFRTRSTSSEI